MPESHFELQHFGGDALRIYAVLSVIDSVFHVFDPCSVDDRRRLDRGFQFVEQRCGIRQGYRVRRGRLSSLLL